MNSIFRLGEERSYVFLRISEMNELRPPVHHENCLEKGIGCFGNSRGIASNKSVNEHIDDIWQFSRR